MSWRYCFLITSTKIIYGLCENNIFFFFWERKSFESLVKTLKLNHVMFHSLFMSMTYCMCLLVWKRNWYLPIEKAKRQKGVVTKLSGFLWIEQIQKTDQREKDMYSPWLNIFSLVGRFSISWDNRDISRNQ